MERQTAIRNLEALLAKGKESALLRFGLGNEHLKAGDARTAAAHLKRAIELDPEYSAAWKLLGKALTGCGEARDALDAYRRGIEVAERRGDKQAAKEMAVFAGRLERQIGSRKP
ncbi:MAG TPA: tetratricopeptide repeat protein [Burkholderiales bacterium]|nr:tetratricopeptide repeat protein [Burkholderiales bacterium]